MIFKKILLTTLILINLYKTNGCFRPFVSESKPINYFSYNKNNISTRDLNDYNTSSDIKNDLILIDSPKTCNKSFLDKTKIYFKCYHNGKCFTVEKKLNSTHYERHSFCVCQKNYSGEDCSADDSFLDEANLSITLIAVLAGVLLTAGVFGYIYVKKKPRKFRPSNNNRNANNHNDLVRGIHNPNDNVNNNETGLLLNTGKIPIYRQESSLSNNAGEVINNLNILRNATNTVIN